MEEEKLAERAERIGAQAADAFDRLARRHAFLVHPRGLGAMRGIEVVAPESGAPDAVRANRLVAAARERGVLLMTASGNVIRTLMPLTIPEPDLEEGLRVIAEAADAVAEAAA
jgi:4-aminobutyrate aminotransferase-like enzyme